MPSSYTPRNRLTLQATGEAINLWGQILNSGAFDLIDKAMDGVTTISASGPTTLTTANGADDQARSRVLNVTATGPAQITIPSVEKFYIVRAAVADVMITNGAASLIIKAGDCMGVITDGVAIWPVRSTDFAGQRLKRIGAPLAHDDAATRKYVDDTAFATQAGSFPGMEGSAGLFLRVADGEENAEWADPLPPRQGKEGMALVVDPSGIPAWSDISQVGDILTTARNPGSKYLPADGSSYLRTAWPELSPLMPDGGSVPLTSWNERTVPAGLWSDVIYGGGQFVAVSSNSAIAATSPDGIAWTQRTLPVSTQWRAVAYGNGTYVAIAAGGSIGATSPDGITWTQRTLPTTTAWGGLAFGNGVFVAISVADNTNIAATSPDGITWTQRTLPTSQEWRAVAFGGGVFVAVGGIASAAATSLDGVVWTQRAMPASGTWRSVAYGDGQFLAITESTVAAVSPDGVAWSARTLPAPPSYWFRVRYGSGLFVAVGGANGGAVSPDGVSWTNRPLPGASTVWNAVAYGAGVFVAMTYVASSTRAATSNKLTDATLFRVPKIEGHDTAVSYIKGEA